MFYSTGFIFNDCKLMVPEHNTADSTVESLLNTVPAVNEEESCRKVLGKFHENKKLYALPVVNNKNRPVGMILRLELTEFFSKPYSIELKGKKPISSLMDSNHHLQCGYLATYVPICQSVGFYSAAAYLLAGAWPDDGDLSIVDALF